ncbi:hypothetical protein N7490_004975 [Penicillium lividum]|nr:hypothetical protein N7490_004975 [Penicillium lividum]
MSGATFTYVRCDVCITSVGKLSPGNNVVEFMEKDPCTCKTKKKLIKNIATFMKADESEITIMRRDSEISDKPAYMSIDGVC